MPTYSESEFKKLLNRMDPEEREETLAMNAGVEQKPANVGEAEIELLDQVRQLDLVPEPETQYRFNQFRKWTFDLCWVPEMIAVEIDGGIWLKTEDGRSAGHANPKRFISDIEKLNEAALAGWLVLRFTPQMVRDGTAREGILRAFIIALNSEKTGP